MVEEKSLVETIREEAKKESRIQEELMQLEDQSLLRIMKMISLELSKRARNKMYKGE